MFEWFKLFLKKKAAEFKKTIGEDAEKLKEFVWKVIAEKLKEIVWNAFAVSQRNR